MTIRSHVKHRACSVSLDRPDRVTLAIRTCLCSEAHQGAVTDEDHECRSSRQRRSIPVRLFRPVSSALVNLLRGLPLENWDRPTIAGAWLVRDVVAHLLDSTLRRLSFHRDGATPPPPPGALDSERDFVDFINDLNAHWVKSAKRLSPRVLTDLYERASARGGRLVRIVAARRTGAVLRVVGGRAGFGRLVRHRARVHGALAPSATDPNGDRRRFACRSTLSRHGDRCSGARIATCLP